MTEIDAKIPRSSEEIRLSGIFDVLTRTLTEAGEREDGELICRVDVEAKAPLVKMLALLGLGVIEQPFPLTPFKAEVTYRPAQPDFPSSQSPRVPNIRLRLWNPKIDSLDLKGKEKVQWIKINGGEVSIDIMPPPHYGATRHNIQFWAFGRDFYLGDEGGGDSILGFIEGISRDIINAIHTARERASERKAELEEELSGLSFLGSD